MEWTLDAPGPLLLEGAMDVETDEMIAALTGAEPVELGCWKCVRGLLDGYAAVVLRTNQGMANAAAATALAIASFAPCAVLNQGTSGGHHPALHRGDLVIGARCVNMGAVYMPPAARGAGIQVQAWRPLGLEIAHTGPGDGRKETIFPADPALRAAARAAAPGYPAGQVMEGVIGSADQWNNERDRIALLHESLGTCTEEMEAAAAAQICMAFGVPFLSVRVLSNSAVHDEPFDASVAAACQQFTLDAARRYLREIHGA